MGSAVIFGSKDMQSCRDNSGSVEKCMKKGTMRSLWFKESYFYRLDEMFSNVDQDHTGQSSFYVETILLTVQRQSSLLELLRFSLLYNELLSDNF